MALYIPGGVIGGAMSGSVGSVVGSRNRSGAYLRTKVIPVNPGTAAQVLARNRMSALSNYWYNGLTEAERAGWNTYAANVAVTNRIGEQIFLTGMNWYVGCNTLRDQAGGTITWNEDAPTVFNLASFNIASIIASEATQQFSVTYVDGDDWTAENGALLGYATRPQNASVNFNAQPFRFAAAVEGDGVTPPLSPQTFPAPFAFVEGQKLWARFNCIIADSRIGAEQKYEIVAVA